MIRFLLSLVVLVAATGCLEDFDGPERVLGPRVIGARALITDQEREAWPAPGEEVAVEFYTAEPGDPTLHTWALILCPARVFPTGDIFCGGAPVAVSQVDMATTDAPTVSGTIPADFMAEELLALGAICVDGIPNIDLEEFDVTCEGENALRELVRFTIPVSDTETNLHPLPGGFLLEGQPWDAVATDRAETGCAGGPLPTFAYQDEPLVITIQPDAASRETFVEREQEMQEELSYTPYITLDFGSFERFQTTASGQTDPIELEWDFGDDASVIDPSGELARVFFVIRDDRSGMSWTERAFCVTP